jgi:ArsR family transcriptional regulator
MKTTEPVQFAKAFSDETRQQIMKMICCQWLSVNEIVEKLNVTQPTVSHHLAFLRDAGLVEIHEDGKQTFYTLNQQRIAECCGHIMIVFAPANELTQHIKKTTPNTD